MCEDGDDGERGREGEREREGMNGGKEGCTHKRKCLEEKWRTSRASLLKPE